mmetsp:Transcript_19864/g.27944  ORF Transcript_19864/g.27944 Transcript_19864/m.27944 type:complete len:391 (+) Transcript_19864:67-1239(+)
MLKTIALTLKQSKCTRKYGTILSSELRTISSSSLVIEMTQNSSLDSKPKKEDLEFGKVMSDHMLIIEWKKENGWGNPKIQPYQNLQISPAASCLNYGLTCFEGMKCYKDLHDKSLQLFRPDCNMERLQNSMKRLSMPGYDFCKGELINCIKKLILIDREWVPSGEGYSLYIRPNIIAMNPYLGLSSPDSLLLYVVTSPVGPYYKTGFKPVRLKTESKYVRAWPGGTGDSKVGGNYAGTMLPAAKAASDGYGQILWLLGDEITEVGAMNIFFVLVNQNGLKEIVTPPLTRGDILPGVTRRSILDVAKSWGCLDVNERNITMKEIKNAAMNGRLLEAFGAGTAAVVTPICCINHEGVDIDIPATGDFTKRVFKEITDIHHGKTPHEWSVKVE